LPLGIVYGKRSPHPPIGAGGQLVGRHQGQVVLGRIDRVRTREGGQRLGGTDGAEALARGPEIVHQLHLEARHPAVALHRDRSLVVPVPGLTAAGDEVLHAVLDPLDGAAAGLARQQARDVGAARSTLAAEAATVRMALDVHLVGGEPEGRGATQREVGGGLDAAADRQLEAHGVPRTDRAEGLGRVGAEPVPAELLREDSGRPLEGPVDLAPREDPLHHHVGALLLDHERRPILHGGEGIGDHVERFVVDQDVLEGVLGHVTARRRDGRHRLADVARLL
jgi:hypothetical protein